MNIFEEATRKNLLVDSPKGPLNVIDLWQLPLIASGNKTSLDMLACNLYRELQQSPTISFVKKEASEDKTLQLAFDVVKHIIDTKLAEQDAAKAARLRNENKAKIMAMISQKEDQQLAEMPLEELRALLEGM